MKNRAILILFSILGMGKGALAETVNEFTSLTTFSVIALGILNAFRPSVFLMVVFLLSMIALLDENKILKVGLSFTAGTFLGYTIIASALMNLHGKFLFLRYFVVAFGIIVGIYKILSSLGYVKISPNNPLREKSNRILEKATSLSSAFLVGGLMSFFSLSCVLPSYLLVTSLLSDGFSLGVRVALLAIFVGISVFPLVLVTLGFHYGNKYTKLGVAVDKLSKMSERGDLGMGVILVTVSILYLLFLG